MFPVDSWETFLQFLPLASQIWLVRTLLAPLRVTPLWLAWPTLRVWWVPSRCCRRSRPTVMGCFAPLGRGVAGCFRFSAGVAFRLFCASALFSCVVCVGLCQLGRHAGRLFYCGRIQCVPNSGCMRCVPTQLRHLSPILRFQLVGFQ